MEGPGGLQFMGSLESDANSLSLSLFTFMHWRRKWQLTPVFLPGESQGREAWWAAVYGVAQSQTQLSDAAAAAYILCVCLYIYVYSSVSAKEPMSLPRMITKFSYIRITIRYYLHQINLLIDNGFWVHSKRDTMVRSPLIGKKALCGRGDRKDIVAHINKQEVGIPMYFSTYT